MVACDCCKIVYACTLTNKKGKLVTPNSNTFNELAACQYENRNEYSKAIEGLANSKRLQAWCERWNGPPIKYKSVRRCRKKPEKIGLQSILQW